MNEMLKDRVRKLRKEKGLSQKTLGALAGLSQQTINDIESGRNKSSTHVVKLAQALQVSAEYLTDGRDPASRAKLTSNARLADNPILPWSDPDELDPDVFALLPVYDAEAAAGIGRINGDKPDVRKEIAFRRDFLASLNLPADRAVCIYVSGDSMSPMLEDGDMVALDTRVEQIENNKVYAIQAGDELLIKQVERRIGGGLLLKSLNKPKWQDQDVSADDLASGAVKVIGRLVYQSGRR